MGRIDNLKSNQLAAVVKRVRRVETTAPLGSTSVHKGRTRFVGIESLWVEGSARVIGILRITGQFLMEGQAILSGGVRLQNLNGNPGAANLTIDAGGNLQHSTFPTEGHIGNLITENAAQQASLNDHERRTGGLENRAGNAEARIAGVEGRMGSVEGTNGSQQSSLNDHERKINGLLAMNSLLRLNIFSISARIQAMDGGGPITPPNNPGV